MKNRVSLFVVMAVCAAVQCVQAQMPVRPDAFPPVEPAGGAKAVTMAATLDEMYRWEAYPTYGVYLQMMQHFATEYPSLCRVDTIGHSVRNRLILCAVITGNATAKSDRPRMFYSSTMHGDEVTGYYLMLRLIDTLLNGYGRDARITELMNSTEIYINPLANPDGTYIRSDNSVQRVQRYNANYVDLNRNYPDPFGTAPVSSQQVENTAMINYMTAKRFALSANLHGGSEVLNYPWDSFTSGEREHPYRSWWVEVCRRFVDTLRLVEPNHFADVTPEGYVTGGDWYVISNGRQDYVNATLGCLEMTMEVSTDKILSTSQLKSYWRMLFHPLLNYIGEVHSLPTVDAIDGATAGEPQARIYPNPTRGKVTVETPSSTRCIDLGDRPAGVYVLSVDGYRFKVVKL